MSVIIHLESTETAGLMITNMLIALVVGLELLYDPFDHIFVKLPLYMRTLRSAHNRDTTECGLRMIQFAWPVAH